MTVLVIDDEDDIRLIAELALKASGLDVIVASGGHEGLALAREHVPDLIVCDVMMPEMDGYATIDALRADPATSRIPVLLLTGKTMTDSDMALREKGVVDFVAKPFIPRKLVERVRTALG